nr:hypothetical protein [Moraxella sp. CTOTU49097]
MKLTPTLMLLMATTLGLTGCQTSKNLLNGFTGGETKVAKLPETSSSRVQFVITSVVGRFIALPDSQNTKANGKNLGIVAQSRGNFDNILFSKEDNQRTIRNNLGMPKPQIDSTRAKSTNVVERYVNANEQIQIEYNISVSQIACKIGGKFTPQPNTDYRITGTSDYKKCYILLEKFVKNADGTTTLQPMRFE